MSQNVLDLIQTIFLPDKFIIEHNNNTNIFSIKTKDDDLDCFTIILHPDKIYIAVLEKCGIKGGDSLKMIDKLSKIIPNIKYIELTDGSLLPLCDDIFVNLAILKILTNGISWYNSYGYVSEDYTNEIEYNKKIINMNYHEFINKVYEINLDLFKQIHSIENYIQKKTNRYL